MVFDANWAEPIDAADDRLFAPSVVAATLRYPYRLGPVRGEDPWSRASASHEKRVAG
jgi:hypothetical protein